MQISFYYGKKIHRKNKRSGQAIIKYVAKADGYLHMKTSCRNEVGGMIKLEIAELKVYEICMICKDD